MKLYQPSAMDLTQYLFFTGKGGVGKTTTACATAINFAKQGKNVVLVSTDPASNLQDVFERPLTDELQTIEGFKGQLKVANFDPVKAAHDYKESVVGPYREILPQEAIINMEEQLMGSCTTEIASFNHFAKFLTNDEIASANDYIIFDTAPTGHTLRMLELPSAWTTYLDENTTGTSCMGQLSGLSDQRDTYKRAVDMLADKDLVTLLLVTRPQRAAMVEAERASKELQELDIKNQKLIINGVLEDPDDEVSSLYANHQQEALAHLPNDLKSFDRYMIPLRPYNVTGTKNLSILLDSNQPNVATSLPQNLEHPLLDRVVDDLVENDKKIIFTMGKGGVGKTSVAIKIAKGMSAAGKNVHLTTTDPANHLNLYLDGEHPFRTSYIDEKAELKQYQERVLAKAKETMSEEDLDYVKEDLRSPCTQEIAVFSAFADVINQSEEEVTIIDTAPTGHTLLLLQSTENYAKEVERSEGEVSEAIQKLLPRLQNERETEVVMVTLPETTPVYESLRLQEDLNRTKVLNKWWVVNQSMLATQTTNHVLQGRAEGEVEWISKVAEVSKNRYAVIGWNPHFDKEFNNQSVVNPVG